jgi:hypothetical protein
VLKDLRDLWVHRVRMDRRDILEQPDQVGHRETRDRLELQEILDLQDNLVLRVSRDRQVHLVRLVSLAMSVSLVSLVRLDTPEPRDWLESRAVSEQLE